MSQKEIPESEKKYFYTKDLTSLTKFLKTMLWILLCLYIISIISDIMQLNLLNSDPYSEEKAAANDTRQSIIGVSILVVYIITGITFLRWIYRANLNCHGFGASGMKFSPGWSIGYYFIPVLNLFRPYQAMKEIWKVSSNPEDWQNFPNSPLIRLWWMLWIISGYLGWCQIRFSFKVNTVELLKSSTIISIISNIIDILLCIVAISLISAIYLKQERLVKKQI